MRGSLLFIEIDDLDAIEAALADAGPVAQRRRTSYGADALIVLSIPGRRAYPVVF